MGEKGGEGQAPLALLRNPQRAVWDIREHLVSRAATAGTCTEKDRRFPTG